LPASVSRLEIAGERRLSIGWLCVGGLTVLIGGTTLLCYQLLDTISLSDKVEITAHRVGAMRAPENSLAGLRQSIVDRADWAEIDVQLTRDNVLVILHDIDLARIGGGNRRVDAVTFAEIRRLDIGSLFSPKYQGETVPTFEEMLAAAGDQIRVNVELKPHGKSDETALTQRVVSTIQRMGMVNRCRVCSQSQASLLYAKQLEPSLTIGFISATSIGDLARLDVDFLMMKSDQVTRDLVERAAARQIAIHAWTVNDPAQLAPLLDRNVANIITDDPAAMRSRLEKILALSPVQRLLLRASTELAGGAWY
jgi:glycerophosphoryl diester phosphodiesterase